MTTYLKASDTPVTDLAALAEQHNNKKVSHYRQGYEGLFDGMPKIEAVATNWNKQVVDSRMWTITNELSHESWVKTKAPVTAPFLRTVIGMEKPICNGVSLQGGMELIVVNWKKGVYTPTHGHPRGYMHERLIYGRVRQATYRIVDAEKRIVRPIGLDLFCNTNDVIDAGFNDDAGVREGAFVHDFTFLEASATLNLVPSHPKDGKSNGFTVEEFAFKHISFQLDKLVPISLGATLKLLPGEVILVRSSTTKDLGDHFYVINGAPREKAVGMRPVGRAIQASADFSNLLDAIEPQPGDVRVLRLMPELRDWFLEWHGIQIQKQLIFPQP